MSETEPSKVVQEASRFYGGFAMIPEAKYVETREPEIITLKEPPAHDPGTLVRIMDNDWFISWLRGGAPIDPPNQARYHIVLLKEWAHKIWISVGTRYDEPTNTLICLGHYRIYRGYYWIEDN